MQNITVTKQDTYAITFNKGYILSVHGGIKVIQLILGIICVLIAGFGGNPYYTEFFLIVAYSFLIGTFCHIFAEMFASKNVLSGITDSTKIFRSNAAELVYGYVYNGLGAILYITSSGLLMNISHKSVYVAAVIGLINGIVYLIATIINGKF